MRSAHKSLTIYSIIVGLLALVGIIARMFSLLRFYDIDIGYYRTAAVLPDIFHGLCVLMIPISLSVIYFLPKSGEHKYVSPMQRCTVDTIVGAIFAAFGVGAYVIYGMVSTLDESGANYSVVSGAGVYIEALSIIFGFFAIIYFILVAANKTAKGEGHVYFGYAVIAFVLMSLAKTYFDFYTTMNSPNKMLLQITFMTIMVYLLYELRFSIGRAAPRVYSGFALLALYFTAVCSVPGIVGYFIGIFDNIQYLVGHFVCFGFCVYICARIIKFAFSQKK